MVLSNPQRFVALPERLNQGESTFDFYDSEKHAIYFIDILQEASDATLLILWDEEHSFRIMALSSRELQYQADFNAIAGYVLQELQLAEYAVTLLNAKRISQLDRYGFNSMMLVQIAASACATKVLTIEPLQSEESLVTKDFFNALQYYYARSILNTLATSLEYAETLRKDYWRTVATVATYGLKEQGINFSELPKPEQRKVLNDYVFSLHGKTSDCFMPALIYTGKALGLDFSGSALSQQTRVSRLYRRLLYRLNHPPKKQHRFLQFEAQEILPFGNVDELILAQWHSPGESDLEIIGFDPITQNINLSPADVSEIVNKLLKGNTVEEWLDTAKEINGFIQDCNGKPEESARWLRWLFQKCRHSRRYLRSRYGIDLARRRLLRKAVPPSTPEALVHRAISYALAINLETASEAARFTFDWLKTESEEAKLKKEEAALLKGVVEGTKTGIAILESLPLFFMAIQQRAQCPIVRDAMTHLLAMYVRANIKTIGIEANRRKGFRKLTKDKQEEALIVATLQAISERQLGAPLVGGRGSLRNRISVLLEDEKTKTKGREVQPDSEEDYGSQVARTPHEFVLAEECRALVAKEIAHSHLSSQEYWVMRLKLLEGKTNKEIAEILKRSEDYVNSLRSRAYRKNPRLKTISEDITRRPRR
jgi:DNA-binding CsgD family transcriptional regulator